MLGLVVVTKDPATRCCHPLPENAGTRVDEMDFTVDHLPDVRRFAATHARAHGLDEDSVADLVIAINEIATNGVRHGSPWAELRMWSGNGSLFAEVRDHGVWTPPHTPGEAPPSPDAEGGMGLWVTRQICSSVHIQTGDHGTVVLLEMPLPAGCA